MNISVQGVKGGSGVTTLAVALAHELKGQLIPSDSRGEFDARTILAENKIKNAESDIFIYDDGLFHTPKNYYSILVLRNDFLSLAKVGKNGKDYDLVVILNSDQRTITPDSISKTIENPNIYVINDEPRTQKLIDSGLFTSRTPNDYITLANKIKTEVLQNA